MAQRGSIASILMRTGVKRERLEGDPPTATPKASKVPKRTKKTADEDTPATATKVKKARKTQQEAPATTAKTAAEGGQVAAPATATPKASKVPKRTKKTADEDTPATATKVVKPAPAAKARGRPRKPAADAPPDREPTCPQVPPAFDMSMLSIVSRDQLEAMLKQLMPAQSNVESKNSDAQPAEKPKDKKDAAEDAQNKTDGKGVGAADKPKDKNDAEEDAKVKTDGKGVGTADTAKNDERAAAEDASKAHGSSSAEPPQTLDVHTGSAHPDPPTTITHLNVGEANATGQIPLPPGIGAPVFRNCIKRKLKWETDRKSVV